METKENLAQFIEPEGWDRMKAIDALAALARNTLAPDHVRDEARRLILVVADAGVAGVTDQDGVEHLPLTEGLRRLAVAAEKGIDDPAFERMRSRVMFERNGRVCRELFVPREEKPAAPLRLVREER